MEIALYQGAHIVGGSPVALSALWQRAPVVLNFWAALCPPCRAEMPDFQRLSQTHRPGSYLLVGVDIGPFIGLGTRDQGQALLHELQITYPAGTTFDARIVRAYQIVGMPTTVFIATDGTIVRRHTGLLTLAQMRAFTDELLAAPPTR
jgi:cytochrome c-type biogenesis protein